MSANNQIYINRKTFEVWEVDVDSGFTSHIGEAKNLNQAIDMAEEFMEINEVEYGVHFKK